MNIEFRCEECQKLLTAEYEDIDRGFDCPNCGHGVIVPFMFQAFFEEEELERDFKRFPLAARLIWSVGVFVRFCLSFFGPRALSVAKAPFQHLRGELWRMRVNKVAMSKFVDIQRRVVDQAADFVDSLV